MCRTIKLTALCWMLNVVASSPGVPTIQNCDLLTLEDGLEDVLGPVFPGTDILVQIPSAAPQEQPSVQYKEYEGEADV